MHISYVTPYNALDIHSWSGLGYFISKALKNQNNELDYIGDLEMKSTNIMNYKRRIYSKFNQKFDEFRELSVAKYYANQIDYRLIPETDIIFSPGSVPIAFIKSKKPKVLYSDATFAGIYGFYDEYSNYCKESVRKANYIEQKALDNCDVAIYASDWAAKTALDNYKVSIDKVKIVPFGANIEFDRDRNEILKNIKNKNKNELHLLFVGVDWIRKGGDFALKVVEELNKRGIKTILHVVGIPNLPVSSKYILNYGFISKSTENGILLMDRLFNMCHFLILPTIAEAYGLVFCEANSYGLPAITTNVGGIKTIIKDNLNGMTFPLNNQIKNWVDYIFEKFIDQNAYEQICINSLNEYNSRLNWDIAGKKITEILNKLI